ncbi:cation channel sperm-associated auxiliary subunit zeta [Tamandua tetradactyla]|uniref:cation channel sperm-associated auxiliary subunit zeta n=1 Tax=Tamandua tetradactyla TaxID=48850 RepID=UPI004053A242
MEEKASQESVKFSDSQGPGKSRRTSDVRNLWTTDTLSLQQLPRPLPTLSECSDSEGEGADPKAPTVQHRKATLIATAAWDELEDGADSAAKDKDSFTQEVVEEHVALGMELPRAASAGSDLGEGDDGAKTEAERASVTSLSLSKYTPHRAYWAEQQNRLPLPLRELMEDEALDILTKALHSYRVGIGWDHMLTKQLQRHIEGLKRRQNKRLNVLLP